jgi:hypothetical protein
MPDHIHLFVCGSQEFVLEQWGPMLKHVLGRVFRAGCSGAACRSAFTPASSDG